MKWIACVALVLVACGKSESAAPAPAPADAPASAACKKACAHRAGCIPAASDQAACLADCTALVLVIGDEGVKTIDAYTAADCAAAQREEPGFQQAAACLRGCKHVLACGVAGTFPGCMTECAQNLQRGAYSLDQLAAITTADCNTVKQNVRLASAPPDGACADACRNFERCGLESFASCAAQCPQIEAERLTLFASASCEQLRTGDFGFQGFGCMREGKQDCAPGMMCCRHSRATTRGEQGQCLYPALCYHRGI